MSFELTDKIGREAVNLKNLINDYKSRGYLVHKWRYEAGKEYYTSSSSQNNPSLFRPVAKDFGNPRYGFDFLTDPNEFLSYVRIIDFTGGIRYKELNWNVSVEVGGNVIYNRQGVSPDNGRVVFTGFPAFTLSPGNATFRFITDLGGEDITGWDFFEKVRMEIVNFIPAALYVNSYGSGNDRFTSPDSGNKNTAKTFFYELTTL